MKNLRVPCREFAAGVREPLEVMEMQEWLGLAFMDSRRLRQDDHMDPYLSRYQVPDFGMEERKEMMVEGINVVRLRWHGFIHPMFIVQQFFTARRPEALLWFAFNVSCFKDPPYTVLCSGPVQCFVWE